MPSNTSLSPNKGPASGQPIGIADAETKKYFRELFKDVDPQFARDLTDTIALRTASLLGRQASAQRTASKNAAISVRPVTAVRTATGIAFEGLARVAGQSFMFSATAEPSFSGKPEVKLTAVRKLAQWEMDLPDPADEPYGDGYDDEGLEQTNHDMGAKAGLIAHLQQLMKAVEGARYEIDDEFASKVDRTIRDIENQLKSRSNEKPLTSQDD